MTTLVNDAGLVASFSIIYACSRQTFALSRAGYLPRRLSVTNARKAPVLALLVPGVLGFLLSLTGQDAMLLDMAVFGATVSYVLVDLTAALWTLVAYAVFLAYFGLYSRHHLVASAPEEEFEALATAARDVR